MNTGEIGWLIFMCVLAYFGLGGWLAYIIILNDSCVRHQEEKILAVVFFWPIIFIGGIIFLYILAVFEAIKGLYYIARDAIKEG